MIGYKKAAVLLHGLSERDRRWLLAGLPISAGNRIKPLLEELKLLGIPRDRDMLAAALEAARMIDKKRALVLQIDGFDGARIFENLQDEPLFMIRGLLAAYPWTWAKEVEELLLQNWGRKGGKKAAAALRGGSMGQNSELLLLRCFVEKLERVPLSVTYLTSPVPQQKEQ